MGVLQQNLISTSTPLPTRAMSWVSFPRHGRTLELDFDQLEAAEARG
jgi:hypothetical protein